MTTTKNILASLTTLLLLSGCYYDKEELLYPAAGCTPGGSTYSGTISPIINSKCNSCHSSSAAPSIGNNIVLDNYNSVKAQVSNGKLLGSINHAPGFPAMPKGGSKLTTCDIAKVSNWIGSGAQNN